MGGINHSLMLKLAVRNTFRNTRRTLLTVFLIGSGLAALLFTDAFVKGMVETMINISTQTYLGHGQIHHKEFRKSNDVDHFISEPTKLYARLNEINEVSAYSPRVMTGAMISSSQNVASTQLLGIQGEQEARVSKLKQAMIDGQYLSGQSQEIILGSELADLLDVKLGERLVVTVSAAHGGELSQELFRLSGIFQFNDRQMDTYMAFTNLDKSQKMLNIDGIHEIAVTFKDLSLAEDKSQPFWDLGNDYEVLNWRELVPQLNSVLEMSQYSTLIVTIIMFCLVSLGLINSMFMSIYERHQELGVLLSVGTRPIQIFTQVVLEGAVIGCIASVMGMVVGSALSLWFSIQGIDYGSLEYGAITLNDPIYLIIDWMAFFQLAFAITCMTILACIYPAFHAARLSPSYAMRKTN